VYFWNLKSQQTQGFAGFFDDKGILKSDMRKSKAPGDVPGAFLFVEKCRMNILRKCKKVLDI
jgi:hypothetical protein